MPKRAFDDNGGIPPWVTTVGPPIKVHFGTPEPAFPEPEPTDYRSPANVTCPTCHAAPETPCQHLNGGGIMTQGWHRSRERVK